MIVMATQKSVKNRKWAYEQ